MKPITVIKTNNFFRIDEATEWTELETKLSYVQYQGIVSEMGIRRSFTGNIMFVPASIGESVIRECVPEGRKLVMKVSNVGIGENYNVFDPIKMHNPPFDYQSKILDEAYGHLMKKKKVILNIPTGSGKSYLSMSLISKLNKRALVLVKSDRLGKQYIKGLKEHSNAKSFGFVRGFSNLSDLTGVDIVVTTHKSMSMFLNETTDKEMFLWTRRNMFEVVLFDECDQDTRSMFNIMNQTTIEYMIMMTATLFLSSDNADKVYQRLIKDIPKIGGNNMKIKETERSCVQHFYSIKYHDYSDIFQYGGFNLINYKNDLFFEHEGEYYKDGYHPELYELMHGDMMDRIRAELKSNDRSKIAIFIPTIAGCDRVYQTLIDFGLSPDDVGVFNSGISKEEKKDVLNKRVLVTIISSLGRGIDISSLNLLMNFTPFSSLSMLKQLVGRIDRVGSEFKGLFVNYNNLSFLALIFMAKKLHNAIPESFKAVDEKWECDRPQQFKKYRRR